MSAELKQIHIELTNKCNLHCAMCYRQDMVATQGEMSLTLLDKISHQIASINTIEKVFLHWRGEPTCYHDLVAAVKILSIKDVKVILFTNGIQFDSDLACKIIKQGVHAIYFSVEATDSISYYKIRGSYNFCKLVENISNTIAIRNQLCARTKINISTVLIDENISKLSSFINFWGNRVDNIEYHIDSRGSKYFVNQPKQCQWPFEGLFISWNGVVSACCMDINISYPLGNVHTMSLLQIFNSECASKLRSCLSNDKSIGMCGQCNYFLGGKNI